MREQGNLLVEVEQKPMEDVLDQTPNTNAQEKGTHLMDHGAETLARNI